MSSDTHPPMRIIGPGTMSGRAIATMGAANIAKPMPPVLWMSAPAMTASAHTTKAGSVTAAITPR